MAYAPAGARGDKRGMDSADRHPDMLLIGAGGGETQGGTRHGRRANAQETPHHRERRGSNHCAVAKAWSKTLSTVALSSVEAELTGICAAAAEALGLQAICADLGLSVTVRLRSDASPAIGVCKRRGLGRLRHLAVADLWIQDRLRTGDLSLHKVAGNANPADSLAKHVDGGGLQPKHLTAVGMLF